MFEALPEMTYGCVLIARMNQKDFLAELLKELFRPKPETSQAGDPAVRKNKETAKWLEHLP
jgi:hypothetical protein